MLRPNRMIGRIRRLVFSVLAKDAKARGVGCRLMSYCSRHRLRCQRKMVINTARLLLFLMFTASLVENASASTLRDAVQSFTLPNGLCVIVAHRPESTLIS